MDGHTQHRPPASDSEVFFASVLGVSFVLLLNYMLAGLLARSAEGVLGASLLVRTAPLASVRLLFTFFVLLPSLLAFAGIGIPFFLRTLRAAVRGRLSAGRQLGLVALATCVVGAVAEVRSGRSGVVAVALISLLGLRLGFRAVASIGEAHGFRLQAAAGVTLVALAWYERRVLQGADPGVALAPTVLVVATFLCATSLLTVTVGALCERDRRYRALGVGWVGNLACFAAPLLRGRIANSVTSADRLELAAVVVNAVVLMVLAVLERRR